MCLINLACEAGLNPKKVAGTNGGEYATLCPRCGGNDRFRIWPNKQMPKCFGGYWCRKCGIKGDSIQFSIDFFGLNFKEAAEKVNATSSIKYNFFNTRDNNMNNTFKQAKTKQPTKKWIKKALSVAENAHKQIWEKPEVLEYLKERGLPEKAVKKYKIGWNHKNIFYNRISWGLEEVKDQEKKVWLPGGIVIPTFDCPNSFNNVVRLKVRRNNWKKGDKRGKYIIVTGSANCLSIVGDTAKPLMVVVESELDAYAIHHITKDFAFSVAVGSIMKNPDYVTDALAKSKKNLFICYDNDKNDDGKKLFEKWKNLYPHAIAYPTPVGKDIGEAINSGFDIRNWLLEGLGKNISHKKNLEQK